MQNMQNMLLENDQWQDVQVGTMNGVHIGKLLSVKKNGQLLVDYQDNPFGPLSAQSIICVSTNDEEREILLTFEKNNPQFPIITGFIQKQPVVENYSKEVMLNTKKLRDITIDGERIVFNAKKEIVLRCGKGSVTIRTDGRIVIKGTDLVSRSKGMNKIKGTSVKIN